MALFQKKPVVESSAPYYQIGDETSLLIVGLGNVGKEYLDTRHNVGFRVVDFFAKKQGVDNWLEKKDLKCVLATATIGGARVVLIKPTTYMNKSGEAVQAVQHFYKIPADKTLVVHDDIDVDFGQIRLRLGGQGGGNKGMRSVIEHGGEHTKRMRVGIGPKKPEQIDSSDFVLAKFTKSEEKQLPLLLQESNSILSEYAHAKGDLQIETRSFIL